VSHKLMTCPNCDQEYSDSRLRTKYITEEACPYCEYVVRSTERWSWSNDEATAIADIAAIDTWIEDVSRKENIAYENKRTNGKNEYVWLLRTGAAWQCEIAYLPSRPDFMSIRLISTDDALSIVAQKARLHKVCGHHGVEPFAVVQEESALSGTATNVAWGAMQHVSIDSLCEEQFEPILDRLDATMRDMHAQLSLPS
jgi:hypothetical protein